MQVVATPRLVTVAATQFSCTWTIEDNLVRQQHLQMLSVPAAHHPLPLPPAARPPHPQATAERLVRAAAADGANIILLQVGTLLMPGRRSEIGMQSLQSAACRLC